MGQHAQSAAVQSVLSLPDAGTDKVTTDYASEPIGAVGAKESSGFVATLSIPAVKFRFSPFELLAVGRLQFSPVTKRVFGAEP